ncbi:hypothetical protein, partial [Helicobacter pylori]|uniref:hypothetical protein n=1 Tax=Helicobacter pylori TaxID=210 RepID=UPI000D41476D
TNKDALEIKNYLQERLSAIHPSTESSAKLSQFVESKIIKNAFLCATNKDALEIKNYLQERLSAIHPSTESSAKLSQFVESKII